MVFENFENFAKKMGIYGMFFFGPLRDSGLDSAGKKVQKRKMLEDLK